MFLDYLSFIGYVTLLLGLAATIIGILGIVHVNHGHDKARVEKSLRYTSFVLLSYLIASYFVFLDWSINHGLIVNDEGRKVADIPASSISAFIWWMGISAAGGLSLFFISEWMKRRRVKQAYAELDDLREVLRSEHGDSAIVSTLVQRAGHDKRPGEVRRDDF